MEILGNLGSSGVVPCAGTSVLCTLHACLRYLRMWGGGRLSTATGRDGRAGRGPSTLHVPRFLTNLELCSVHILEHAHFHPAWKQVRVAADWGKAPRTEIANGKWPETTLGWLNYARWESLENLKSQPFQAVLDVLTAKLGTSGAA